MTFWDYASNHWFLSFILMYCALSVGGHAYARTIRGIIILVRGWPKNPLLDADGDFRKVEEKR